MRRIALLFSMVVASLIPVKRSSAEVVGGAASAATIASVSVVTASVTSQLHLIEQAAHIASVRRHDTGRSIGMVMSWILLVALVGFVLMAFGADKLEIVIRTMQQGIGKSLGSGLIGQLAIVPGAVAVVVMLAATLIGILLVPLGLVAFMFIVAGVAMFGFIAVATMTGAALTSRKQLDDTANGAMLRSFLTGTAAYLGLWLIAAALSGVPLIGPMLASFASAVTFIAVTTGFGAVLLSYWRGGFKKAAAVTA